MTIFGFAKYLALRLIEQPSRADGAKPYAPNAGNIFFALFAAVGMVGAVGYGFNSVLRGPISAMTETTKRTVAESTVITSSRLAIVGATTQQSGAGDTDNDGFIEPVPYRDAATAPHPVGGGFLPTALNIPNTIDPWNTEYGYCAWDHGSVTASSRRLAGSPNNNRHAIAIISAGKDKRFQTSCVAYVDDTTNLIQRTAGSDDIVLAYTYAEANDLGNGLWKPHASVANTATTDRNIDVTGGGLVSGGVVLSGNTTTGGGLILPSDPGDDSISGACDAMNDNQLRYNISDPAEPPVIEICDNGGLGWSPVSGGAGGGGGVTTGQLVAHYKFDESTGTTAADETGNHDGTLINNPVWSPGQGRIDGALRFTATNNTDVSIPRDVALEPSSITIAAWIRRDGAQPDFAGIISKQHSGHYTSYDLQFSGPSDTQIEFIIGHGVMGDNGGNTPALNSQNVTINNSVWYHVVATYTPSEPSDQMKLYINGQLNNTRNENRAINYGAGAQDLHIGSNNIGSEYFNGSLDDVRIYNYGMTTEEVTSLYNSVNTTSLNLDTPQKSGAVYSWGNEANGSLGNGTAETAARTAPGPIESTDRFIDISSGNTFGCGLRMDGTAWCWGSDTNGKLGNGGGVTADQPTPYQVSTLSNLIKISAGDQHACALRNDGAVFCWGLNTDGRLGDGTTTARDAPVQVLGLANAIDVAAGYGSTCAVVADGRAWCWGLGTSGQLGNGLSTSSNVPVQVSNVTDFTQISLGKLAADDPSCGVTRRGIAYCWGTDTDQQLGNGAGTTAQSTPGEVVAPLSGYFSKISVNDNTVCALTPYFNGSVACWGAGSSGQLGYGASPASVHTPTFVINISKIVDVAVNNNSVCAVESNGNVWCWGEDSNGKLGNGEASAANSNVPVLAKIMNAYGIAGSGQAFFALVDTSAYAAAASPQYAKKFSSGHVGDAQHTCHIRSDGTMWCWGVEQFGELGNGGGSTETAATPVRVTDPGPWMSVSAGQDHTCGIKVDGTAWCWGSDASGQLGDGATAGPQVSPVAVSVATPTSWAQIAAGRDSTCGIKSDGSLFCWGSDAGGRLGNGAGGNTNAPGTAITSALPWIQVSTGEGTCGIKSDNSLWCWGTATNGRLGNGTITPDLETPARTGTDMWRYIDETSPCGIKTDGSLWCWGLNINQKLGIGTTYTGDQSVPRLVVEPGPWASVNGTYFGTACAVKMDGTGWCWGDAADSMGTGGTTPGADVPYPIPVLGKDWVHIEGGADYFKCGVKKDDSVWCWGNDSFEVLGNGVGNSSSNYPQRIYQPYKSSFTATDSTTAVNAATPAANLAIGTTVPLTNIEGTVQGMSFPGSGRTLLSQATTPNQFTLETATAGGAAQIWLTANRYPYYMGYSAYTGGLEFGYGSDWLTNYTGASLEVSNNGFTGLGTGGAPVARLDVRGAIRAGDAGSTCDSTLAGTIKYAADVVSYCNGNNWVEFGLPSVTTVGMLWDTSRLSIDPGVSHTCGITAEGSLWCWGSGANDRLGTGSTTQQNVPAAVSIIGKFLQVTTGKEGGCALRSDHTVWCWGTDTNGMLGNDGVDAASAVPVQVSSALGWVQISGYYSFTCGIKTDGTGWCWGRGTDGQRGDSTNNNNAYVPVQISGAGAWSKLSVGRTHACGIKTDATLWCWGENLYGQLGHGGTINTNAPVQVGVGQWVDIAVARWHSCGIMVDGTARCWGRNSYYEIGDNTNTQRNSPTALTGTGTGTWKSIAAAEGVSCGIKSVGTAWCWGAGSSGQRGDGTTTATLGQAVQVTAGGGWSNIYAGNEHVCATRPNSRLYCWGQALNGKLGNGTTTPNVLNPWLMP